MRNSIKGRSELSRRSFLERGIGLAAALAVPMQAAAQLAAGSAPDRLVLLGTKGGPRLTPVGAGQTTPARMNPASLLVIGGVPYVIDCGYGVSLQLLRAGIALRDLRYIFVSHHHSDHELEYGNLVYNGWAAGLNQAVDAYGPAGIEKMTRDFLALNEVDIETRIKDEGKPDLRKLIRAHALSDLNPVLDNAGVRVSAMRVLHPPLYDSYAFKFEFGGKTVVFSGDTTYHPKLAAFARNADYLVHEAMYLPGVDALVRRVPNASTLREHLLASHTTTEDTGRIAAAAEVKNLVLTHLVPGDDAGITDAMWAAGVAKYYKGNIIVGKDLLSIAL